MSGSADTVWETLHRHLSSIYAGDWETYLATTVEDVAVFEWFVTPHRIDGRSFHEFMLENDWMGVGGDWRYDLLNPRLQLYGTTAIVSYTLLLSINKDGVITHKAVNESRVLIEFPDGWKIVHVHKSPGS